MEFNTTSSQLQEVARRIREMREITGLTEQEMAVETNVTVDTYRAYEAGAVDLPFSFIHKCAQVFGLSITDLLEGHSANLSSYTVTRRGEGQQTAREEGIEIQNLAPLFRNKVAEPYWVRYEYSPKLQNRPIHLTTHAGQEFDLVLKGRLKVQIGDHVEVLGEGDSIYYNSATPHGMIAVDGQDCLFCAVVLPGEEVQEDTVRESIVSANSSEELACEKFVKVTEDAHGSLETLDFENEDDFNFAFDVVDAIAERDPDRLAMIHLDKDKKERRFTFG
ncbi:MAG: cupin domain-containing protein, partial [Clostridia bacterium]|nr:cupin domain-containing protein [Clostridia bacterium]